MRDEAWAASPITEERGVPLVRGALGGLAAAVAGGAAWAWVVRTWDYEVGFLAWGIGLAAGAAVVAATGGARGRALQVVAVAAAAVGLLLGKYLSFVGVLQDLAREQAGGAAVEVSALSTDVMRFFGEERDVVFGGYDLLWFGLAILTAWRVPGPRRDRPARKPPL